MPRNTSGLRRGGPGRTKGSPNKATVEVKALAQKHGPSAVSTLATIMQDAAQPPQARVAAARELLDRGYGKSKETLELKSPIALEIPVLYTRDDIMDARDEDADTGGDGDGDED